MSYEKYYFELREEAGGDAGGGGGETLLSGGESTTTASQVAETSEAGGSESTSEGAVQDGPWFKEYIGHDGLLNKDRLEHLPEELKPFRETMERYDTFDALLRAHHNSRLMNSGKGLEPLPPGASEEAVQEFEEMRARLNNTPEEASGYNFTKPDSYPAELPWNQESVDKYAEILHRHQASPELAKELFDAQMAEASDQVIDMNQQLAQAAQDGKAELQRILQAEGTSYDETIQEARRGLQMLAWDGFDENHPVMNNPHVIRLLAAHAKALGEDTSTGADGDGGYQADARAQALDIVRNPDNQLHTAYHDPEHVNHDAAVAEKQRLDRIARAQAR